jgi:hypothetical protein
VKPAQTERLTQADIDALQRLRRALAVFDFADDAPYVSEAEARLDAALNLDLADDHARLLWAAGVRARPAYRDAAALVHSGALGAPGGRRRGPALRYLMGHALDHLDLLRPSRGPGGTQGGNAAALLDALDEQVNAGEYHVHDGVHVRTGLDTDKHALAYRFVEGDTSTPWQTRGALLPGPIKAALKELKALLPLVNDLDLPG